MGTVDVTDGLDAAEEAFAASRRGEVGIAYGDLYFQTAADPTPAPQGKQLMSASCQYVPPQPGQDWEKAREQAGRTVIELIERFAPGFEDQIEHYDVLGPPEIEERIGLTGGNIFQGVCMPDQMWENRFSARTPIDGFYLAAQRRIRRGP